MFEMISIKYQITIQHYSLLQKMGPKASSRRLTERAIEKMVEKYAISFGKPALSVHKLRHSFATEYHF
ncbi:hypothetical protein [Gottfriedia endophytica]|uniref:hypothetical protein n=1 Tax=Gottfriedia endophytica TaxID=2820819 RepID=UPI002AC33A05|nr:hypothetical protein [Gottfriedia endophytica]